MAVEKMQVYFCERCGILVQTLSGGTGALICCGKPMDLIQDNTEEAATEKHIPVVEHVEGGLKVTVGEVEHPMDFNHAIEWIEVRQGGRSWREFLSPTGTPHAFFPVSGEGISVHAYCNLHGLWMCKL